MFLFLFLVSRLFLVSVSCFSCIAVRCSFLGRRVTSQVELLHRSRDRSVGPWGASPRAGRNVDAGPHAVPAQVYRSSGAWRRAMRCDVLRCNAVQCERSPLSDKQVTKSVPFGSKKKIFLLAESMRGQPGPMGMTYMTYIDAA